MALAKAIHRNCQPTNRPIANRLSANVAAQPTHGIIDAGKNQLSLATYALKCAKSPHSTPPVPAGPHNPKRSATAERNAAARATRSSKTAVLTSLFFIVFILPLLGKDKARALGLTRKRLLVWIVSASPLSALNACPLRIQRFSRNPPEQVVLCAPWRRC